MGFLPFCACTGRGSKRGIEKEPMRKSDSLVYYLSTKMIVILLLYDLTWLLGGMAGAGIILIRAMEPVNNKHVVLYSFSASAIMSGMLCTVQYIRRLYKV